MRTFKQRDRQSSGLRSVLSWRRVFLGLIWAAGVLAAAPEVLNAQTVFRPRRPAAGDSGAQTPSARDEDAGVPQDGQASDAVSPAAPPAATSDPDAPRRGATTDEFEQADRSRKPAPRSTLLDVVLLSSDSLLGLDEQTWGRVFEKLGRGVRVRSAETNEQPEVSETVRGTLRTVNVVGRLDRQGRITFPDNRSFSPDDAQALGEWLDELEVYGAQGSPEGQQHWGLSRAQFEEVFLSLARRVEQDVRGTPLNELPEKIGVASAFSWRVHSSAVERLEAAPPREAPAARQDVRGLAAGSAIAALLADAGLAFRPLRSPEGRIEFVIQPLADMTDPWPVGWPIPENRRRDEVLPALFAMTPIGFPETPLPELLDRIRQESETPVVLDLQGVDDGSIDLAAVTYGLPRKRTAWVLVLGAAIRPTGLQAHYLLDETGQGFVRLIPFKTPHRAKPAGAAAAANRAEHTVDAQLPSDADEP